MSPSGIEPATFGIVAQSLNQLRHSIFFSEKGMLKTEVEGLDCCVADNGKYVADCNSIGWSHIWTSNSLIAKAKMSLYGDVCEESTWQCAKIKRNLESGVWLVTLVLATCVNKINGGNSPWPQAVSKLVRIFQNIHNIFFTNDVTVGNIKRWLTSFDVKQDDCLNYFSRT